MNMYVYAILSAVFILKVHGGVPMSFSQPINENTDYFLKLKIPLPPNNITYYDFHKKKKQNTFLPDVDIPEQFSPLANVMKLGQVNSGGSANSLRTVMMGGMLYGLSLIPSVVMALSGSGLPGGSGLLSSIGMNRRSFSETSSAKFPMLSEPDTRKLLSMLQQAFKHWSIADEECKQLFVCQMYRQVADNGINPDLDLFKEILLQLMEYSINKKSGRAAHFLLEYEHYFDAARKGLALDQCENLYPTCELSLYSGNKKFQKKEENSQKKKNSFFLTRYMH